MQVPICEIDPWRTQYFESVPCPADVFIPTEDSDGWMWNPAHRWVYDKLAVALSQGLEAAPHGVAPQNYPVFSKPIYNLKGMGVGSRALLSPDDYASRLPARSFLDDAARRRPCQQRRRAGRRRADMVAPRDAALPAALALSTTGRSHAMPSPAVEDWCGAWCRKHLQRLHRTCSTSRRSAAASSRCICASPINGPISTARAWVEALVRLYAKGEWPFDDRQRRTGYSVVLFSPHGRRYRHPPADLQHEIAAMPGVSSLQITFHEELPPGRHAMPPGGFRVAIVNCWDRAAAMRRASSCAPTSRRRRLPALGVAPQEAGEQADHEQHQRDDEQVFAPCRSRSRRSRRSRTSRPAARSRGTSAPSTTS